MMLHKMVNTLSYCMNFWGKNKNSEDYSPLFFVFKYMNILF